MTFITFFEEDELKLLFYSVILFYGTASVFKQETQLVLNLKTSHRSFHEMLSQEMGMSNYVIGCRERETSQILRDISFI